MYFHRQHFNFIKKAWTLTERPSSRRSCPDCSGEADPTMLVRRTSNWRSFGFDVSRIAIWEGRLGTIGHGAAEGGVRLTSVNRRSVTEAASNDTHSTHEALWQDITLPSTRSSQVVAAISLALCLLGIVPVRVRTATFAEPRPPSILTFNVKTRSTENINILRRAPNVTRRQGRTPANFGASHARRLPAFEPHLPHQPSRVSHETAKGSRPILMRRKLANRALHRPHNSMATQAERWVVKMDIYPTRRSQRELASHD